MLPPSSGRQFIWLDAAVIRRKSSYTVDTVPPPFFGIEPNKFNQPEDGGSMFSRNVRVYNYYTVQKPKSIPSYEALCDDVSYWLVIHEIGQLGLLECTLCVMLMVT